MKHLHTKIICGMLALLLMAGCSSTATPPQSTETPTTSTSTTTPDDSEATTTPDISEEVTIDWYYVGNKEEIDNDLISEEISKITKEKINAKVQMHVFDWGSYQKKIDMMIASGEKIDLLSTTALPFPQMVAKDSFLDIGQLYADYGQDMAPYIIDYNLEGCKSGGKLYAIPTPKESGGCYGYVIRQDLIEAANIDLSTVKTMEDLTPIWAKLKELNPDFSIYNNASGEAYLNLMGYQQVGDSVGRIYRNSEAKIVNEYEDENFQRIAKLWNEWYIAGYINKETTNANFAHTAALRDDKIQAIGGQCKNGIEAEVSAGIGGKYEFTKVILEEPLALTFTGYECALAIPRTSPNPERTMMFLNLLFSDPELHNLANFGLEGRNYVTIPDGRIDFPEGSTPDTLTYNPNMVWQIGNAFISKWWTTYPVDHVERLEAYNSTVQPSIALGFVFDSEPVKTEIAACLNVKNEFERMILSGSMAPEEYVPRMLEQYKAAGIDKIIAEKQAQLDAWMAAK